MYKFFAFLSRMKYIERWNLMHSNVRENIAEHTQSVCVIAHALALITNRCLSGNVDEDKVLKLALYHECTEVITGDLPTPIKYFNAQIKTAYGELESYAAQKLLSALPPELQPDYQSNLLPDRDSEEFKHVKAADKLCAYIKCKEELSMGNREFKKAAAALEREIKNIPLPALEYFCKHFLPAFSLTLDELE